MTNSTPELPAAGGGGTITVTAQRECVWSARAEASWITLRGTSGQGTASVNYTVAANPAGTPRRGQVVVSEQTRMAAALLLPRHRVITMAANLLVLFPVLFIYDTRLGAAALALAVVFLYRKASTSTRRRAIDRRSLP